MQLFLARTLRKNYGLDRNQNKIKIAAVDNTVLRPCRDVPEPSRFLICILVLDFNLDHTRLNDCCLYAA